ncbi:MAG TPA: class I SAM-dependent methyltransferase [Actinomycetota bacterium]
MAGSEEYGTETYGERWASIYDAWTASLGFLAEGETVASKLVDLAGGGPALELAIGTGRVALPLSEMGVEVHGIDASPAMVAKLREKPGGEDIAVTMGDFADVAVDGRYRLVYVVFNTFFALRTQEDQVRCFANVTERLTDDGLFVLEAFMPDVTRFDRGQRVETLDIGLRGLALEAARHDAATQQVEAIQVMLEEGQPVRTYPVKLRYCYPSELDLMARLAGLRLRDRWGGWEGELFTSASPRHVSVYERDPGR